MKQSVCLLSALVTLSLAGARTTQAALISVDLNAPGDGLLTRDTASSLEWLDLTQTVGYSYDQITGGAGGFTGLSFRHATEEEVADILPQFGFVLGPQLQPYSAGLQFMSQFGCTFECFSEAGSFGISDFSVPDPALKRGYFITIELDQGPPFAILTVGTVFSNQVPSSPTGHFLVRNVVPEPKSLICLLIAILGIIVARSRYLIPLAALQIFVGAQFSSAQDAYNGMVPRAGNDHRHVGMAYDQWQFSTIVTTATPYIFSYGRCFNHEWGRPSEVYNQADNPAGGTGFAEDWLIQSHHDAYMTLSQNAPQYTFYKDGNSNTIGATSGPAFFTASGSGFPNASQNGAEPASFGHDEWRYLNSVAEAKNKQVGNTPPNHFVAISGIEYTTPQGNILTTAGPTEGGHKILIPSCLPTAAPPIPACDSISVCAINTSCLNENSVYAWALPQSSPQGEVPGAAIIQAHPCTARCGDWPNGFIPWDANHPGGFSNEIHGVEIGGEYPNWERAFQTAIRRGYRLFPSYGSDQHNLELEKVVFQPDSGPAYSFSGLDPSCHNNHAENSRTGATVCWVPSSGGQPWNQASLVKAMRDRRCYFATESRPEVKFQMRNTSNPSNPWVPMGSSLASTAGSIDINISATNALSAQNEIPSYPFSGAHRFDRLEIVRIHSSLPAGQSEEIWKVCDGSGPATCKCTRQANINTPDECQVTLLGQSPPPGAYYVRICKNGTDAAANNPSTPCQVCANTEFGQDCDLKAQQSGATSVITAPIYIDFPTPGPDPACPVFLDPDGDLVPSCFDKCPNHPNGPNQANTPDGNQKDADFDGLGEPCDPDDDGDGVLDGADNCPKIANQPSAVPHDCNGNVGSPPGPGTFDAAAGVQCDQDGDGLGDPCDPCPHMNFNTYADQRVDLRTNTGAVCLCGDVNNDAKIDASDFAAMEVLLFQPPGGCSGMDQQQAKKIDITNDGLCTVSDLIPLAPAIAAYSFQGLRMPCAAYKDTDGDRAHDPIDNCPTTRNVSEIVVVDDVKVFVQTDSDLDGIGNICDRCPYYSTSDQNDANADGRGNKCQCSDANVDGLVNVADLVQINTCIFNPSVCPPGSDSLALCDGNNDGLCNVSDIVAANIEIFQPGCTSICGRYTSPVCSVQQ